VQIVKQRQKVNPGESGRLPQPVQLLELGSRISDVTAMVWQLVCNSLRSNGFDNPMDFFAITNCEYEIHTGMVASDLLAKTGRANVKVMYGPQIADATRLDGMEDSTFDIVWTSFMLGAFPLVSWQLMVFQEKAGHGIVMH